MDAAPGTSRQPSIDANVFGIDYGSRRIGVAMGGMRLRQANALGMINNVNGTPDWSALDTYVTQWEPAAFILGWPLELDGSEPPIIAHVKGFKRRLRQRYDRPVYTIDERYSSMAAEQQIADRRRDGRKTRRTTHADVDAEAAAVILGRWFDQQTASPNSNDDAPSSPTGSPTETST